VSASNLMPFRVRFPAIADEILIFANPIAGRGQGQRIARRLAAHLASEGFVAHTLLKPPETLGRDEVVRPKARAAIAIGGDGTLRAVTDRLARECDEADCPVPPVLIVPLGTANLMGRHLGIRWNSRTLERDVTRVLRAGKVMQLDAARANGSLFLLMVGVGFDAHVVHELARVRTGPIRMTSYLLPAALAVTAYAYPPLTVSVDGKEVFTKTPGFAFVGNVAEYGTGFPILPHARSDDGVLDVCVMPCRSPADLVQLFLKAAAGEHLSVEGVVYLKGKRVRITSTDPVPVQLDGDSAGHTPVDIDLLPVRLPFIVP
jgi:YegS/Rv2252/BmrU family lipid kinase